MQPVSRVPGVAAALSCRLFRGAVARVVRLGGQFGELLPLRTLDIDAARLSTACWRPELGAIQMVLSSPGVCHEDWSWLRGQTMIAAFLMGVVPSIDESIVSRRPLAIAGRSFREIPARVIGNGGELSLRDGDGSLLGEWRRLDASTTTWSEGPNAIIRLGSVGSASVSYGDWMSHWLPSPQAGTLSLALQEDKHALEEAVDVIEENLPLTALWIAAVCREMVLSVPKTYGPLKAEILKTFPPLG